MWKEPYLSPHRHFCSKGSQGAGHNENALTRSNHGPQASAVPSSPPSGSAHSGSPGQLQAPSCALTGLTPPSPVADTVGDPLLCSATFQSPDLPLGPRAHPPHTKSQDVHVGDGGWGGADLNHWLLAICLDSLGRWGWRDLFSRGPSSLCLLGQLTPGHLSALPSGRGLLLLNKLV